jgi:predicted dehydrogenase
MNSHPSTRTITEPVRLVQVGLGGWGRNWNRIVRALDDVTCVGYADSSAQARDLAQRDFQLPQSHFYSSVAEALEATDAEAVLVTTNLHGHVPVVQQAIEAGKHVIVEKPFAPTVEEARRVVESAEAAGVVLMVSQNYRFFPAIRAVKRLLDDEGLGPVGAVNVDFRRYANTAPRNGHKHYKLRHPLLMDMAIHHFDLMCLFAGARPTTVACRAWNPEWSRFEEPAAAYAVVEFPEALMVSYRGSWVSSGPQTPWSGRWRLECRDGEIVFESRSGRGVRDDWVTIQRHKKRLQRIPVPRLQAFGRAGALQAFVEAIRTGTTPESSGRENLKSLGLMFATIEAAESGSPVRVV